jgi:hypothetical protein
MFPQWNLPVCVQKETTFFGNVNNKNKITVTLEMRLRYLHHRILDFFALVTGPTTHVVVDRLQNIVFAMLVAVTDTGQRLIKEQRV